MLAVCIFVRGWEQCLHSLQHWRRELSARLEVRLAQQVLYCPVHAALHTSWQAVDEAYGEMAAAIDAVPNCVWADAPAKHASGKTVNGQQEATSLHLALMQTCVVIFVKGKAYAIVSACQASTWH